MTNLPTPFDPLINSYLDNKIGIDIGFLSKDLSDGLRKNILELENDNQMMPAGIGNANVKNPKGTSLGTTVTGNIHSFVISMKTGRKKMEGNYGFIKKKESKK